MFCAFQGIRSILTPFLRRVVGGKSISDRMRIEHLNIITNSSLRGAPATSQSKKAKWIATGASLPRNDEWWHHTRTQ